jgi:hypothetical protein
MAKSYLVGRDAKTGQFVLGRESFVKISAVEGIRMPKSMTEKFAKLDREKASAGTRRAELKAAYGKKK